MNASPTYKVFSLGYRCSSAGILKLLNFKTESYPFDWLVSRLHVVRKCIEDDFKEFLNLERYIAADTNITEMVNGKLTRICDEHIIYHNLYTPADVIERKDKYTYAYHLALNHKNLFIKEDYEYYTRCVERFRNLLSSEDHKMYLHIHKMMSTDEYNCNKNSIVTEFIEFQEFMKTVTQNVIGVFFIIVKDSLNFCKLELIEHAEKSYYIYTLHTNKNCLDAGEILMGDYLNERHHIAYTFSQLYSSINTI